MEIYSVTDERFKKYGKIIKDIDFSGLVNALEESTPLPENVAYVPGLEALEGLPVMKELRDKTFGEAEIKSGYCNGHNSMMNALEYHKSSEVNVMATDAVLMLGREQDITDDFTYDTSLAEAFLAPKGTAVEIYATTLHYAPCGVDGEGFKVAIVLPKGTNLELDREHAGGEDGHLTAKNKWLLGH
ncbi:MAG: DUF4867 family protein, partial [Lachnospiraceae bacterium]|nr:DUF4867 family protein [Lachnospiraceae bacterium]